jgi:hypothetical protein
MAAKDSNPSSFSNNIFGGDSKLMPPASHNRITRPEGNKKRSHSKLAAIRSRLKKLQGLINDLRAFCQSVGKLLVTLSSIVLLVSVLYSYFRGHLNAQHLQSFLRLFR